jgi:hypothetical protein
MMPVSVSESPVRYTLLANEIDWGFNCLLLAGLFIKDGLT